MIKTAVEEPESNRERAILLIEKGRDSRSAATRAQHLSLAPGLQKLAALPPVQPPKPTGNAISYCGKFPV